jgi:gliding motility-associated-like protein
VGLPTEQQVCKEIEVFGANVDLGPDTTLCEGKNLLLDAGSGFESYLWNNGVNTQTLIVNSSGTYSVRVSSYAGCQSQDSIHVVFNPNFFSTIDTSICFGQTYFAGGQQRSSSGTYVDTLSATNGCNQYLTTNLTVEPFIPVNIGKDTCITEGTILDLVANVPGATLYTWQDGSHDSTLSVTDPGLYWVRVSVNTCMNSDSIHVNPCPVITYFYMPTAFTPNGDGVNDIFRPIGTEIVDYHLIVFDRWGQMVFESSSAGNGWDGTFKGSICEPGVYSYTLTYRDNSASDHTVKTTGFVTLVR